MKRVVLVHRVLCLLGSLLIGAALSVAPAQANPGILYVAPGGNCGATPNCYATIQAAIDAAVDDDEIRVAAGTYTQVSTGKGITSVARIVDKELTLRGGYTTSNWTQSQPTTHPTVIDPNDQGIGMFINYQMTTGVGVIIVDGFSITDGNATTAGAGTDSGGGVLIDHTTHFRVTIQNCKIYANAAEDGNGGGIWSTRSDNLQIMNSEIYENEGSGVVITYGDNLVIANSVIRDNAGDGLKVISDLGGGTDIHGNEITGNQGSGIALNAVVGGAITDNLIRDNHTTGGGGGLDISGVTHQFAISGNTIHENSALQGGGIDISGSVAQITGNLITANATTPTSNGGGGLYVDAGAAGSYVLVSGNQILSNTTTNLGGGLVMLGEVDLVGNTIAGNAAFSGGGLIAAAKGTISNNLISGNTAQIGGGLRAVNAVGLVVERNRVIGNQATNGEGGGLNLWGGFFMEVALDGNQVISNTASEKGGGIYVECPTGVDPIEIANTVLAHNVAATGSGLYATVCDVNLAYSTVAANRGAWGDGVGIYLRDPLGEATSTLENSILVKQTVGVYVASGSAALEATFWGAGAWANDANTGGPGTITPGAINEQGDPAFVDPANNDYHIAESSPVIDKGIDTWARYDMDGQVRPTGETDIGADESGRPLLIFLPLLVK